MLGLKLELGFYSKRLPPYLNYLSKNQLRAAPANIPTIKLIPIIVSTSLNIKNILNSSLLSIFLYNKSTY